MIVSLFLDFVAVSKKMPFMILFWCFCFAIGSLKRQINDGFRFNFSLLQKCPKNDFFGLKT